MINDKYDMKIFTTILTGLMLGVASGHAQEVAERHYEVNLENDAVSRFMSEVTYAPGDSSVVKNYIIEGNNTLHHPRPVVIDLPETTADTVSVVCYVASTMSDSLVFRVPTAASRAALYNLIPQRDYVYEVCVGDSVLQQGEIHTKGQVRMIRVDGSVINVRDLGGWLTSDGKQRIKYGKLFRGSELNWQYEATPEGLDTLRMLGVGAEIDMRAHWEALDKSDGHPETEGVSVFGFQNAAHTPSGEVATYLYTNDSGQLPTNMNTYLWQYKWRQQFQFIVNNLRCNRAIYCHCIQGKDRTGYLSLLLEGLLGVGYSDMLKDYELTHFILDATSKKSQIDEVMAYIEGLNGATLRDKFNTYFTTKIRVSQADIDYFREVMLEDVNEDNPGPGTGVHSVGVPAIPAEGYYDLSGRRLSGEPKRGVYLKVDGHGGYRKMINDR